MLELIGSILAVIVIAVQSFAGYRHNKYLGMILPILFVGSVIYLIAVGRYNLSFTNILMPIVVLIGLIGVYLFAGRTTKK